MLIINAINILRGKIYFEGWDFWITNGKKWKFLAANMDFAGIGTKKLAGDPWL